MSKRNRNLLVLIVIAVAVVLLLAFAMFGLRYGINVIVPMRTEFKRGADYGIVRTAVYQIADEAYRAPEVQTEIMENMKSRMEDMSVAGVRIYTQGTDKIRIDIPRKQHQAITSETGLQEETISFLSEQAYFLMSDPDGNPVYDSKNITGAELVPLGGSETEYYYGVLISLDETGTQALAAATAAATEDNPLTFNFTCDGESLAAPAVTSVIDGSMILNNNFGIESASRIVSQINAGAHPAALTQLYHYDGDPLQGSGTFYSMLNGLAVALLAALVVWVLLYKSSGLMAALSMLFVAFLFNLGYATIETVLFTPAGLIGYVAALALALGFHTQVLESLNRGLYADQDVLVSIKSQFRRSVAPVLDCMIVLYLSGIVGINFGGEMAKDFFITLLIGGSFALVGFFLFYGLLLLMAGIDGKQGHYKRLGSPLEASVRAAKAA